MLWSYDDEEESPWILSLAEQESASSFDEKEDEAKDEMLWSLDEEKDYLWIESRKELDSTWVDASDGESLLSSEEF